MITEIGIVAGEIWHYLDEHGETTLSALLQSTDQKRDLILMCLGWLSREGHIMVSQQNDDYIIQLRRKTPQSK